MFHPIARCAPEANQPLAVESRKFNLISTLLAFSAAGQAVEAGP
jgi:hypothetical protein